MASGLGTGLISSTLADARKEMTTPLLRGKPTALPQLAPLGSPNASGGNKAQAQFMPQPPSDAGPAEGRQTYQLNALKSPRHLRQQNKIFTDDTFLYAEKHVNPVIERLAQQLVLHNPAQDQIQSFVQDALLGNSLSTKYPVNRDLTALKKNVGIKSEPKKLLPVTTRKVLDNLVLSIFKTRPTNVKAFLLETGQISLTLFVLFVPYTCICISIRLRQNPIVDCFQTREAHSPYPP